MEDIEDIDISTDWDKNYHEGVNKIIEAQNVFIPVSESINCPPFWEKTVSIWESLNIESTTNKSKPPKKKQKTFIPGKVFFPKDIDSRLTKKEQAMCVSALGLYQSGRSLQHLREYERQNIATYMSLQSQIKEENVKFLEYVKADWERRHHRADKIKVTLRAYAFNEWEQKLKRSFCYAQFYKPCDVIPLTVQDDDPPIAVEFCKDILHLGTVAKFSRPTLISKYTLKVRTLPPPENEHIYNSKLAVSQDAHVKTLVDAHAHDIDVVISMSTLKKLLDDSKFDVGWDIPVVIKRCNVKLANGTIKSKNVIYIDKPLPKRILSNMDFNEKCHKRLIKTNLCKIPEIIHPNSETTRTNPNFYKSVSCAEKELNEHDTSKDIKNKTDDDTIGNKNVIHCSEDEGDCKETVTNLNENIVHHNVSYSIWNIRQEEDKQNILMKNVTMKNRTHSKNIKFLVRCKVDACERLDDGTVQRLVVVPKLEYQLEHGANIPTKSELIRQWTDLFFRPFSHLYRVRMESGTSEVVAVESVSMQKINTEANTHYKYKPSLRPNMLYTVFSVLDTLQPGNYLLHHTPKIGPFVELLKEVDLNNEVDKNNIFDLHNEYNKKNCQIVPANNTPWCPIDVNYILPVHSTFKRMPGMFKPLIVIYEKKPKKKNKKAAKKKGKGGKNAKNGTTSKP